MDGDKTTIFQDVDGSVSEYPGAFLVKEDNWLLRHPDCIDVPDWKAAICSGRYAQVGHRLVKRLGQINLSLDAPKTLCQTPLNSFH